MIDQMGKRDRFRQMFLSYLLLAIIAWISYFTMLNPVLGVWHAHIDQTHELRQAVLQKEHETLILSKELSDLQKRIDHLLEAAWVSSATDPSLVSHGLQQQVKKLLKLQSGEVIQLSPGTVGSDLELSNSSLDIRFQIRANRLDALLQDLNLLKPSVAVQMLSLRQASTGSSKAYEGQLDASFRLSVLFFSQPLVAKLSSHGIDVSSPDQNTNQPPAENESEQVASSSIAPQPHLAGLFDADFRVRLRDPSPDQYRLAAITLSKDARVAVIADPLSDATYRLRVGEYLHDWRIESIEQTGVSLVKGKQSMLLELPGQ